MWVGWLVRGQLAGGGQCANWQAKLAPSLSHHDWDGHPSSAGGEDGQQEEVGLEKLKGTQSQDVQQVPSVNPSSQMKKLKLRKRSKQ